MKTKISLKDCRSKGPVYFSDLDVGDWYDSGSTYGICIKTGLESFYSLGYNLHMSGQRVQKSWACVRLNVAISFREAA